MGTPDGPEGAPGAPPGDGARRSLERHYDHYLSQLIKKERKNISIRLGHIAKNSTFDIYTCEEPLPGTMEQVAKQCAGAPRRAISILPDRLAQDSGIADFASLGQTDERRDPEKHKYLTMHNHIKTLARSIQQEEEETGEQVGYVGFPFLEGQSYGKVVRGPVVLFAASLVRKKIKNGYGWALVLKEQDPTPNIALIKTLEKARGVKLEDVSLKFSELVERMGSDKDKTLGSLFEAASEWAESMFDIGSSRRVSGAAPIARLNDENTPDPWPLHMANRMAFGKFPQADVAMAGDYRKLREMDEDDGGLIADLFGIRREGDGAKPGHAWGAGPGGEPYDRNRDDINSVPARKLNAVCPSDTSQDMVILESKSSPITVVKGPPGTGKSQLIVNMAADAMYAGQKVLVVCQKRAALEVVHSRLANAGLDECAVLMNKESDDRREVYRRMSDVVEQASKSAGSANAAFVDRDGTVRPTTEAHMGRDGGSFHEITGEIDQLTKELVDIGHALYAKHRSGAIAHNLYCIARSGYVSKKIPAIDSLDLTWDGLGEFARRVGGMREACIRYDGETHPLHGRRSLSGFVRQATDSFKRALESLAKISDGELGEALRARHECGASAHEIYELARDGYATLGIPAIGTLDLTWDGLGEFARRVGEMQEACIRYDDEAHPLHGRRSLADAPPEARARLRDTLARLAEMSGGELGEALRARHECGASAHEIYELARDGYATLGIPAIGTLDLTWDGLGEFARRVGEMQEACIRYDDEAHPLHGRRSLADAPPEARARLRDTLARLADISESVTVCASPEAQAELCKIMDSWGKKFPWVLHKPGAAKHSRQLAGRKIDESDIEGETLRAHGGAEWWEKLAALREFFTEEGLERLKSLALPHGAARGGDHGKAMWESALDALGEHEQIRAYDALKQTSPGKLLNVLESLRKSAPQGDWGDVLTQEMCLKWATELGRRRPALTGVVESRGSGTEWSNTLGRLCEFFDEPAASRLRAHTALPDSGHERWTSMLSAAEEYDKIRSYDELRKESPKHVLDALDGLRNNADHTQSWSDIVTQEFCLRWVEDLNKRHPKLPEAIRLGIMKEWQDSVDEVCRLFDERASARLRESAAAKDSGHGRWVAMLEAMGELAQIQEYDMDKAKLPPHTAGVLEGLRREAGAEEDWGDIVTQEVCLRWINDLDTQTGVLRGDPLPRYNRLRDRLRERIAQQQTRVRDSIVLASQESIRVLPKYARNPSDAQIRWRDFSREVKRKRGGKPVRVLFEKYAENFLSIAPCWLMSPAAASRILPLQKGLFDLVIVDEASQLTVEKALPVIYRGKRAVIAGDDKQLTPFDLFQAMDDDEDDSEIDTFEEDSLFDKACATRPPSFLSWHYRSRHQELIDFSNHAFYGGSLNVAPNVVRCPGQPPIRWIACNGVWANRTNSVEVHRSAELVYDVWRDAAPDKMPSVAIVTFNREQRDAISDELERRYENDEEFRRLHDHFHSSKNAEKLIVRNIENIQGDERDVVIFSIGYARETDGVFRFRSGTLSRKGGENRLNVAITRARESMMVVCSIAPSDLKGTYKNLGPKRLRQFLEYAKATSERDRPAQEATLAGLDDVMEISHEPRPQQFDSEFEKSVAREFERLGNEVKTQIGQSGYRIDLAIVDKDDPTRYVVGIECDGAMFHSARSVRERDVLRQDFLEKRGWVIERIWSTSWYRDRSRETARIMARINELREGRRQAG